MFLEVSTIISYSTRWIPTYKLHKYVLEEKVEEFKLYMCILLPHQTWIAARVKQKYSSMQVK